MNNKFSMNEKAMYLIAAIFILIIMYFRLPPTTFHSEGKSEKYTLPQSPILASRKTIGTYDYVWFHLKSPNDLELSIAKCEQEAEMFEGKFFPMRLERGGNITDLSCREFYERLFGEGK